MSATIQSVVEQPAFTILIAAITVAMIENLIVAFSASLPWFTNPDVHAFFMASVLATMSVAYIFLISRKHGLKVKGEVMVIPFIVFSVAFFFDRYLINYIKSLALPIKLLSLSLSTAQASMLYGSVALIVFVLVVLGLIYLYARR